MARLMAERHDFAHGVWTALAATLAEPLREALADHLEQHGCGQTDRGVCEEAWRLWDLLPDGDRVLVAYGAAPVA